MFLARQSTRTPSAGNLGRPARRVAKRGVTRIGSALCGVFGFQQHLGLWTALFGGVGWLVVSDQAGFLLRRRYGTRLRARLSRWKSRGRLRPRLAASLQVMVALPEHLGATPYRVFALINTVGAVAWGALFVGIGYFLACLWDGGRPNRTGPALLLISISASLIALGRWNSVTHADVEQRVRRCFTDPTTIGHRW